MPEKLVLLALLPVVTLIIFLGWAWVITTGKKSTKLSLRGLGLSIEVTSATWESTHKGKETPNDVA